MMSPEKSDKLPSLLSAVLNSSTARQVKVLDTFSSFLSASQYAVNDCGKYKIPITASSHRQANINNSKVFESNTCLMEIFKTYCKLFEPLERGQIPDKERIDIPKDITFKGVENILFDFMVIPKLLSRDELIDTWRSISIERIENNLKPLVMLSFDQFLWLLSNLAVRIFNRRNLMRTLSATLSEPPTAVDAINYLCHYMNLANSTEILSKLEILERSHENSRPIKTVAEQAILDELSSESHPHTTNLKKTIFSSLSTTSLIVAKSRSTSRKPFTANKTKMPFVYPTVNRIPSHLLRILQEGDQQIEKSARSLLKVNTPIVENNHKASTAVEEDAFSDNDEYKCVKLPDSFTKIKLERYHIHTFDKYYTRKQKIDIVDLYSSDGPFVDLGEVQAGYRYDVKFIVTNDSQGSINFDVTTTDLEMDDVKIVALPGSLAQGLRRYVNLSFTIKPGVRSVLGFVNIHIFTLQGGRDIISCPVFYSVVQEVSGIRRKRCTIKNLSTLLRNDPRRYEATDKQPKTKSNFSKELSVK